MDERRLSDLLRRWDGLRPTAEVLSTGQIKDNWLVDNGRLVLSIYPDSVPIAAVEQELAWLTALGVGMPEIPKPVISRGGRLVEQTDDGRAAVLTRRIVGDPPDDTSATLSSMASLLGRIHRQASRLRLRGEAWLPSLRRFDWSANLWWNLETVQSLATTFPDLSSARGELEKVPRVLELLAGLPECLIHNDFHRGNLIAAGHEIVGVVDWDWATIDWRVLDVAAGLRSWMLRPGYDGPGMAVAFVDFYSQVVDDFSEDERRLLPHVLWLRSIWTVFYDLGRAVAGRISPDDIIYRFESHRRVTDALPRIQEALG